MSRIDGASGSARRFGPYQAQMKMREEAQQSGALKLISLARSAWRYGWIVFWQFGWIWADALLVQGA